LTTNQAHIYARAVYLIFLLDLRASPETGCLKTNYSQDTLEKIQRMLAESHTLQQSLKQMPGIAPQIAESTIETLRNWSQLVNGITRQLRIKWADAELEKGELKEAHSKCADFAARQNISEHVHGHDIKILQDEKQDLQNEIIKQSKVIAWYEQSTEDMKAEADELKEKLACLGQEVQAGEKKTSTMAEKIQVR
jgi:hypothetical protein